MAVVTRIVGTCDEVRGRFRTEDPLPLTSDERTSPHLVGTTVGGRTIRISLPRESELNDGDVIALDGDVAIVVRAASEDLFRLAPASALEWGIVGFQLGNLHRPVRFLADAILTPADPMVADLLRRLGIAYEHRAEPFVGRRYGAFTGGGHHHHGHEHHGHAHHGHEHHNHRHHEHGHPRHGA